MFFERLEQALQTFDPLHHNSSHYQAAVLVLITDEPEPHLVYAKRADHLKHHPGEICFPGGMWEEQDQSLAHTALRETYEELGAEISLDDLVGTLPARTTRNGLYVLPLVARVSPQLILQPDMEELSEVFRTPLFGLDQVKLREDRFERAGVIYKIPVYALGAHEIWGFTAAVTDDLLKRVMKITTEVE